MRSLQQRWFFIGWFLVLPLVWGCASQTRTVRTSSVTYPDTTTSTAPVVVERETTTETSDGGRSGGVLSSTVNAAGEVIALPFRAVGGLFSALF